MKAFKIWEDEKHYIHKKTTSDQNLTWTTNPKDAKEFERACDGYKFFCDVLGFSYNADRPNALKFENNL